MGLILIKIKVFPLNLAKMGIYSILFSKFAVQSMAKSSSYFQKSFNIGPLSQN